MIGFDNIELSMRLLDKRQDALQQIAVYLQGRGQISATDDGEKGKQRAGMCTRSCSR